MKKKYDDDNSGTLGKNTRQRPDKKDPEYSGEVKVDGTEYWLSAWIKTNGETGEKFFSLAFRPKGEKKPVEAKQEFKDDDLGDVPF